MIGRVIVALWAVLTVAQVGHGAERPTGRANSAPLNCPYNFANEMPPGTFCVYQGVALDGADEVCATDVAAVWSRFDSRVPVGVAQNASEAREVYLGFATDPEFVLRAFVDARQGNRAQIDSISDGRPEATQPLAGEMTLRTVRLGSSGTADVLDVKLWGARRLGLGDCAFASYSGTFIGVIGLQQPTDPVSDTSFAPRQ
jgi:hypothetical protein